MDPGGKIVMAESIKCKGFEMAMAVTLRHLHGFPHFLLASAEMHHPKSFSDCSIPSKTEAPQVPKLLRIFPYFIFPYEFITQRNI